jgi:hypothetical protein
MSTRIVTTHVHPPIPVRHFDWCAHVEGEEEGFKGWGATQQAAIDDLMENHPEAEEQPEHPMY